MSKLRLEVVVAVGEGITGRAAFRFYLIPSASNGALGLFESGVQRIALLARFPHLLRKAAIGLVNPWRRARHSGGAQHRPRTTHLGACERRHGGVQWRVRVERQGRRGPLDPPGSGRAPHAGQRASLWADIPVVLRSRGNLPTPLFDDGE